MTFTVNEQVQLIRIFANVFCTTPEHVVLCKSDDGASGHADRFDVSAYMDGRPNRVFTLNLITDKKGKFIDIGGKLKVIKDNA